MEMDSGGVQAAVYLGNARWMDAAPDRGVGEMTLPLSPFDPRYGGAIRIPRRKN